MSKGQPKIVVPRTVCVGLSPDYPGVILIFDEGLPTEQVMSVDGSSAIEVGQKMCEYGTRVITGSVPVASSRGSDVQGLSIDRDRPLRLDS